MSGASPYAELFLSESREHLSVVNESLLSLERGTDPDGAVRELFRAVHSVKGMSAAMGFGAVADLSHELESLLERMRTGAVQASAARRAISAAEAISEPVTASPSTSRRDASTAPRRAATQAESGAASHAAGTARSTSSGLKLKNVATTTSPRTAPIGADREAK